MKFISLFKSLILIFKTHPKTSIAIISAVGITAISAVTIPIVIEKNKPNDTIKINSTKKIDVSSETVSSEETPLEEPQQPQQVVNYSGKSISVPKK